MGHPHRNDKSQATGLIRGGAGLLPLTFQVLIDYFYDDPAIYKHLLTPAYFFLIGLYTFFFFFLGLVEFYCLSGTLNFLLEDNIHIYVFFTEPP